MEFRTHDDIHEVIQKALDVAMTEQRGLST